MLECCRLRVKDLDFTRSEITVRDGKGRKDRVTMLPGKVKEPLIAHLERVRAQHGRDLRRKELIPEAIALPVPAEELLMVHEALDKLEAVNQEAAELTKLRYFAGFTIPEAADKMRISARKANQIWTYARAWLATEISDDASK